MRKLLYLLPAVLITFACTNSKIVRIDAKVEMLPNKPIVLKVLDIDQQRTVDTIKTDEDGVFRYKIKKAGASPEFYYFYYNENKIASLIVKGGDRVHLITDSLGNFPRYEGSKETILLDSLEKELQQNLFKFASLSEIYEKSKVSGNTALADSLNLVLGNMYVKQKQAAIKHIFRHPYSFTNLVLLYQSFPGDLQLFADVKDALIFQRVHDSLKTLYPESRYLPIIEKESTSRMNIDALSVKLGTTTVTNLPEIKLPDMNAKVRTLSSLEGKVVVLMFWSITSAEQKMYNQELIEIYNKYHDKGFEIFQVSADADKTAWGTTVMEQKLPWISVHDRDGVASAALRNYNISQFPTIFIINREGEIVAKNIFNLETFDSKIASLIK